MKRHRQSGDDLLLDIGLRFRLRLLVGIVKGPGLGDDSFGQSSWSPATDTDGAQELDLLQDAMLAAALRQADDVFRCSEGRSPCLRERQVHAHKCRAMDDMRAFATDALEDGGRQAELRQRRVSAQRRDAITCRGAIALPIPEQAVQARFEMCIRLGSNEQRESIRGLRKQFIGNCTANHASAARQKVMLHVGSAPA